MSRGGHGVIAWLRFSGRGVGSPRLRVWLATICLIGFTLGLAIPSKVVRSLVGIKNRRPLVVEYSKLSELGETGSFTEYVRSDGAFAHEEARVVFPSGVFRPSRYIALPSKGVIMFFDPESKLVVTQALGPDRAYNDFTRPHRSGDSQSDCLGEIHSAFPKAKSWACVPADRSVLGYRVWRARITLSTPAAETLVLEDLLAPALDWRWLERTTIKNGKIVGTLTATKILEVEPPDQLFHVTKDARLTSLATYERRLSEIRGVECETCKSNARRGDKVSTIPPVY